MVTLTRTDMDANSSGPWETEAGGQPGLLSNSQSQKNEIKRAGHDGTLL